MLQDLICAQAQTRAVLGIEPRTSRTRSENHTTRPNSQLRAGCARLILGILLVKATGGGAGEISQINATATKQLQLGLRFFPKMGQPLLKKTCPGASPSLRFAKYFDIFDTVHHFCVGVSLKDPNNISISRFDTLNAPREARAPDLEVNSLTL